jgi:hypothetical protein
MRVRQRCRSSSSVCIRPQNASATALSYGSPTAPYGRCPGRGDRRVPDDHPPRRQRRRGSQLSTHRCAVVPVAVHPPTRRPGDERFRAGIPAPRNYRHDSVYHLVLYQARARLRRATRLSVPALCRPTAHGPADQRLARRAAAGRKSADRRPRPGPAPNRTAPTLPNSSTAAKLRFTLMFSIKLGAAIGVVALLVVNLGLLKSMP